VIFSLLVGLAVTSALGLAMVGAFNLMRVPGDRDHQFQAIVITDSRGA
jgi:uncharacterized membrane protein